MSWCCVELTIDLEAEAKFNDLMIEYGSIAVTCTAADQREVFEINGKITDEWKSIKLTGLFDESTNILPLLIELESQPKLNIQVSTLADQNWELTWLDNFKPLKINNKLWICPSWHNSPDPQAITVSIDPDMSFGTGNHESTRLCLGWLVDLEVTGKTILDYGCGSGILAITALKLGADRAWATDIEPRSLASTLKNARRNEVNEKLIVSMADELPGSIRADIVVANILLQSIIELKNILLQHLKADGRLLLAGILNNQAHIIRQAMPELLWKNRNDGEWIALLGKRQTIDKNSCS